jgi:hypothetical protein
VYESVASLAVEGLREDRTENACQRPTPDQQVHLCSRAYRILSSRRKDESAKVSEALEVKIKRRWTDVPT